MTKICKINLKKFDVRREECLRALQESYRQNGEISVRSYSIWAMKRGNLPCTSRICEIFGSWNKAVEEARLVNMG